MRVCPGIMTGLHVQSVDFVVQTRFAVSCMRTALRGVPLLSLEGHICVTGVLAKNYSHPIDPWSCRSADSLLGPSKKIPSVPPVLLASNIGGARWPQIG